MENLRHTEELSCAEVIDAETLASQIQEKNWEEDPNLETQILTHVISHLIKKNTETYQGKEFEECAQSIFTLFEPYRGFINIKTFEENGRKNFLIYPKKWEGVFCEVESIYYQNGLKKFDLDLLMVHCHYDVKFAGQGIVRGLNTYTDGNLIIGRGANDTKGALSTLPFVLKQFREMRFEDFCFVLTSDEEQLATSKSILPGGKLLRLISGKVNADLEPTAKLNGIPTTKIGDSMHYSFELKDYLTDEKLKDIERWFNCNHRSFELPKFHISYDTSEITLDAQLLSGSSETMKENFIYAYSAFSEFLQKLEINFTSNGYGISHGFNQHLDLSLGRVVEKISKNIYGEIQFSPSNIYDMTLAFREIGINSNIPSFGTIFHNFGTYLTCLNQYEDIHKNILIIGPREIYRRHGPNEATCIWDLINLRRFLVELGFEFQNIRSNQLFYSPK